MKSTILSSLGVPHDKEETLIYPLVLTNIAIEHGHRNIFIVNNLGAVLRAAFALGASGLGFECVPEALHDPSTQAALQEYAELTDSVIHQKVLHLHTCWPARRSRWFATVTPRQFGFQGFPELPVLQPSPVLGDLFPFDPWPVWGELEETQLAWTPLEMQVYHDEQFGSTDRRLNMQEPCPTALHSWGSALYACPCGCRKQGLNAAMLRQKGLRGVEIKAGFWPYKSRLIHPRELQLILGFPPFESVLDDCRGQLVLFGNAVSPVQGLWIFSHLLGSLGLLDFGLSPREILARYLAMLLQQRDLSWPSPGPSLSSLQVQYLGTTTEVTFNTQQRVTELIRAEASLLDSMHIAVTCEGVTLPEWGLLEERTYQLTVQTDGNPVVTHVPVFVEHLGVRTLHLVPATFQYRTLLRWLEIHEYHDVIDSEHVTIDEKLFVQPWRSVIVQLDPTDVDFDLSLRLRGFGLGSHGSMGLTLSSPWCCTGLWHLDQLIKSDLLISWTGTGFAPLTCWLPSFAEAVVELWPNTMDGHLQRWFDCEQTRIFAVVWETWGWNLVRFDLTELALTVSFFEETTGGSCVASYLAFRVRQIAGRQEYYESQFPGLCDDSCVGSLSHVLALLDHALGLPPVVANALKHTRVARLTREKQLGLDFPSPTLSFDVSVTHQLPFLRQTEIGVPGVRLGLTARFVHDFAHALVLCAQEKVTQDQVKVICLQPQEEFGACELKTFAPVNAPLWIFLLVDHHWTLVTCCQIARTLQIVQFDGLAKTSLVQLAPLASTLKHAWQLEHVHISSMWDFAQTRDDSCGTIALAHFAHQIRAISYEQATCFEHLHDSLAMCSQLLFSTGPIGFGADEAAIVGTLAQILPAKGVPASEVTNRANAAIKLFGAKALQQALASKNPWPALKSLGNSKAKPFMWVTFSELQTHIQERAQSKYGAADIKKPKSKQTRREPVTTATLDPASLQLPPGIFVTNCGTPLSQLTIAEVQKDARGVAFATFAEAQRFLSDAKLISTEGLALLVIGSFPETTAVALPMHAIRVPAIYRGTNEPVIVDCVSIQLGDQAVYKKTNQEAPELTVCPTKVLRVHVFKDLWEKEATWEELIEHPIRQLVQSFPVLRLCHDSECDQSCGFFHPSLEEEGVESGLLDTWTFRWTSLDGSKQPPSKADVLSVYIRIPESSFECVHQASGNKGFFFEPRNADSPGPDEAFAVVWTPQLSLDEVQHRLRTQDHCLAVCRLGHKYGLRCLAKHQEALHAALCPHKPFVDCPVKEIYRLEPLPAGTQRASLVDTLKSFGWRAKPLQPCKGSQGKAWQVGASAAPPAQFIEAQHGWIGISKVRDAVPKAKQHGFIATARTKQHIHEASGSELASAAPSTGHQDPWQTGGDPWGGFKPQTKSGPVPMHHVQSRYDDVENRLQQHAESTLQKEVQKMQEGSDSTQRLSAVESQIQSLVENQSKLEHWVTDGSAKVHCLQQECAQLHQQVQAQGHTLQGVAAEVGNCTTSLQSVVQEVSGLKEGINANLDAYFAKQQNAIEAMLAKRPRHD